MKKETAQTPDSKEGLHTQGEWRLEKYGRSMFGKVIVSEVDGGQQKICILDFGYMTTLEEAEANAELIVKAVNFYTNVKDLADKYPSNNDKPHELAHISNNDLSAYKLHTKILLRLIEEGALNERKALLDALKDTLMLAEELKFESEKAYQICETAKKLINNAKNI